MAVQYHVAFSKDVSGAAIFAGGPYYCAEAQMARALTLCMADPILIDVDSLTRKTDDFASAGQIDATSGLNNDQVSFCIPVQATLWYTRAS